MSSAAFCPACGSSLPGVSAFADGPFRCSTCGATFAQPSPFPTKPAPGYPPPYAYPQPYGYPPPPYGSPWAFGPAGFATPEQWEYARDRARQAVLWPAISLMVAGVLFILGGIGLIVWSIHLAELVGPDRTTAIVIGVIAAFSVIAGAGIAFAGWRMKSLRSHGLALTGAILLAVLAVLTFVPLIALAIWPLVVLNRPEVKIHFDREPPKGGKGGSGAS
jgi:hypothetical protein